MNFKKVLVIIGLLLFIMTGCRKEEVYEGMIATDVEVIAVFTPQGLGDKSYVDMIYAGMFRATQELKITFHPIYPQSTEAGIDSIVHYAIDSNSTQKRLIVITDYVYTENLHSRGLLSSMRDDEYTQVLIVGTNPMPDYNYTACVDSYGLMYEAGYLAQSMSDVEDVKVILASDDHPELQTAGQGFVDGFTAMGKSQVEVTDLFYELFDVDIESLIDGYLMQNYIYSQLSKHYVGLYDMVVPICGETMQGFVRYTRENPQSYYVVGMDVDMSSLSKQIPYSCVKHMDRILSNSVMLWHKGMLKQVNHYGLEGNWVEIVISDIYRKKLAPVLEEIHATAIEKEKAYEH